MSESVTLPAAQVEALVTCLKGATAALEAALAASRQPGPASPMAAAERLGVLLLASTFQSWLEGGGPTGERLTDGEAVERFNQVMRHSWNAGRWGSARRAFFDPAKLRQLKSPNDLRKLCAFVRTLPA